MKISVCMATYNGEKYIVEQLYSILSQIGMEDEIIISDDGSCDNTLKLIDNVDDSRIKIVKNIGEHGYTKNFENSLHYATGDIIFLSDQDDVWMPNKVRTLIPMMEKYDYIIHNCSVTDEKLIIKEKSYFDYMGVKSGFINQMIRMRALGCCMVFNRRVLNLILPFPPNSRLVEHDTWISSVAELYAKCAKYDKPLLLYRRHGNNTSEAGLGKGYPLYEKIYRRIYRLFYLFIRGIKFN